MIVGVMSSAVGGYLAGRLRTKWVGVHPNEVFFRDTAHGFLAWVFATLISATALVPTTAYLANGTAASIGGASAQAAHSIDFSAIYVDKLFRTASATEHAVGGNAAASGGSPSGAPSSFNSVRPEILRLWAADFRTGVDFSSSDREYVAQVVAADAGMSQVDAEKRVDFVVNEAKIAGDNTRRNAAHLSFWITAALLFGALSASFAAAEGANSVTAPGMIASSHPEHNKENCHGQRHPAVCSWVFRSRSSFCSRSSGTEPTVSLRCFLHLPTGEMPDRRVRK